MFWWSKPIVLSHQSWDIGNVDPDPFEMNDGHRTEISLHGHPYVSCVVTIFLYLLAE